MGFLLRLDSFVDVSELLLNAIDLVPRGFALPSIRIERRGVRQPPLRAAHHRHHHFQIAQQFGAAPGWGFLLRLSLRFEKQLGSFQNAFADRR
jgi:hypothetical protein